MTGDRDLAPLVDRLGGARVLCVGDVMLDRFVYGEVVRISPEAPVPVCRVVRETAMLGGAGNVARNLSALGSAAEFVGVIGEDAAGEEVTRLFEALDRATGHLVRDAARPTTIKERFIAGAQQLLRVDRESEARIAAATADRVMEQARAALGRTNVVVISDYGKGVLSDEAIAALIADAHAAGATVVVDPKGIDFTRYRGADVITPNRRELADASRLATDGDDAVIAAAKAIAAGCGIANVLATRSADGMTLVSADGAAHFAAEAREVFDVSGAGDTVVAALAAGLSAGLAMDDAARLANVAAGIVVGKVGTAVAWPGDIVAAIRHGGPTKVLGLDAALDRIAGWRAQGNRIGFTNGCFDLIHPGHVALLAAARAACDRLIVALNADSSVRRLKGETRPVQDEAARAAVMESLASVDLVLLFEDDTPMRLIEAIRPDMLAKGADYSLDQVVGGEFVRSYGGEVLLVDLEPGHSTTGTISRMAK